MAAFFQVLGGVFALILVFNFIDWVTGPTSGWFGVFFLTFGILFFVWFLVQLWKYSREAK